MKNFSALESSTSHIREKLLFRLHLEHSELSKSKQSLSQEGGGGSSTPLPPNS